MLETLDRVGIDIIEAVSYTHLAKGDLQKYFDVLVSFEPKSVGGKVPGEDFYGLTY